MTSRSSRPPPSIASLSLPLSSMQELRMFSGMQQKLPEPPTICKLLRRRRRRTYIDSRATVPMASHHLRHNIIRNASTTRERHYHRVLPPPHQSPLPIRFPAQSVLGGKPKDIIFNGNRRRILAYFLHTWRSVVHT